MKPDIFINHVVNNSEYRRELLWLRAKEKGDVWSIENLEEADPNLRARLLEAGLDIDADGDSAYFARLHDIRQEQIELEVTHRERRARSN